MKRVFLSLLSLSLVVCAGAQKKFVDNATDYIKSGDLDKAQNFIDQAITNDKTKGDFHTWTVRGEVYQGIGETAKFKNLSPNPDSVALASYIQSQTLSPANKDLILYSNKINKLYGDFWNQAIESFKNKDYVAAYQNFNDARAVNDLLHAVNSAFGSPIDTLAELNMSKAAYNASTTDSTESNYGDSAMIHLQQLANLKYKDIFIYQVLLAGYLKDRNTEKFMATAEEAKLLYPENTDFPEQEMEYYRLTGQMDNYLKQLQAGVAKDPGNYMLNFNLGVTYDDLANPKDSDGNSLPKPSNYPSLFDSAANSYKAAIGIRPNEYGPNFNLGILYYNRAAYYGRQMGNLGTSKADQAKSDTLAKQQNAFLAQAQPYLEKAYSILDAMPKLTGAELNIYQEAITGLKEIYARKNMTDKYNELDQKLKNADSKLGS